MRTLRPLLLSAFLSALAAAPLPAAPPPAPAGLRCEDLADPLGLDAARPRLAWVLESPRRGERQTAFHILVASSPDALRADRGDLWDSGRRESPESVHVAYEGRPLASSRRAHWKVRVWGRDGEPSPWSAPAFWEAGLLDAADWKAQWIALEPDADGPPPTRPAPLFRTEFTLDRPVRSARAYVCGLGYHELYLNGRKAGDHVLDPAFTRYDRRALYVTHDVTALLRPGKNTAGAILGTGWYNMHANDVWEFFKAPWRRAPRLLAHLRIEHDDGSVTVVATDGTWKTATGPIVSDCIRTGESYDARLEKPGWDAPGYDDAAWKPAAVVGAPGGVLSAQAMPPIRVMETVPAAKVTEPQPGVFVFDLGRNIAGWARINVDGSAGTTVTLTYGERLAPDGTVDQKAIAEHVRTRPFSTDTYILKGGGPETWEPRFVYHGFQYVQVAGWPGRPAAGALEGRVVRTAYEPAGTFACSNDLFNRIQHNTLASYAGNFHGYPTDCPHREKNGWTGDAHLAVDQAMYNMDNAAAYAKWMNDFKDEMRPTGELPGIVPTAGWGYAWGNGPAWDSAYLLIPWALHVHRGDTRILETHYEHMKRYVDYLTSKAKGGIVSIGLGDWVPVEAKTPVEVTSTGYYFADARIVARAARLLGRAEDAAKYGTLAEEIRRAFLARFYNRETGRYANGTQTAQSCALYHGLVEAGEEAKVMDALAANLAGRGGHLDAGILGTKYLLRALTDYGRADLAYGMASKTTYPSWGHWLERGATTLWEDWQGGSSLNHIFLGDISAWFYESLAGLRPDPERPGFRHIVIRPHPVGDLAWVKAETRTVRGLVASGWKKEDGAFELEVTIPANSTATVFLPAGDAEVVTESGKPAEEAEGVKFVRAEGGRKVYAVESGEYRFRVTK